MTKYVYIIFFNSNKGFSNWFEVYLETPIVLADLLVQIAEKHVDHLAKVYADIIEKYNLDNIKYHIPFSIGLTNFQILRMEITNNSEKEIYVPSHVTTFAKVTIKN